jgi:hypothetical protein
MLVLFSQYVFARSCAPQTIQSSQVPKFTKECEPGNEDYTVAWYFALKALAAYRCKNKDEYPGMRKGQEDQDYNTLSEIVLKVSAQHGWDKDEQKVREKLEKALREM